MSMYRQFKTDPKLEQQGIELDYGDFVVTAARAGGTNRSYQRVLNQKTRPYRRAIAAGAMEPELEQRLLRETIAETCILGWHTRVDGELRPGIESPEGGELLPVTTENLLSTFEALPLLYEDLAQQITNGALFRQELQEIERGN